MKQRDIELLSSYLDGQLSSADSARLEARLRTDPEMRSVLQDLRGARSLLRQLPMRKAPRNFTLTPKMVAKNPPLPRSYPVFKFSATLATILLFFTMGLNILRPQLAAQPAVFGMGGGGAPDITLESAAATEPPAAAAELATEAPAFRQVFANLLMPDGTPEQINSFAELARVSASAENAALMEMAFFNINVTHLAPQVRVPVLVLHARNDAMCPFDEGRFMASLIPGARFAPLESNNHILLETEPAWPQFLSEVTQFTQTEPGPAAKISHAVEVTASPTPAAPQRELEQSIRFCQSADGARLAYATIGAGPPLVKAAYWLSHLEFDWQSPILRHWLIGLAQQHTLIRYDERGCGLSDWNVDDFSFEAWVRDLEAVVDAAGVERFPLIGISQGGPIAIAYATRHPERVSHLILYGAYARGKLKRDPTAEKIEELETLLKLIRLGWGRENPAFRQVIEKRGWRNRAVPGSG